MALDKQEINRLSTLHWQKHIIEPMVQQIFPILDLTSGHCAASQAEARPESQVLRAVKTMLEQYLATYGIEGYLPARGARFNPKFMKGTKVAITADQKRHNRVRACLQMGFKWGQGGAIRVASVQLWRYQQINHQSQKQSAERRDQKS